MNIHKNARLTPQGRLLMVRRIENANWRVADAAAAAGLSQRRAYDGCGGIGGAARSPFVTGARRPHDTVLGVSADATPRLSGCVGTAWTGDRIARRLGLPRSTVGAVLRRLGLGPPEGAGPAGVGGPL